MSEAMRPAPAGVDPAGVVRRTAERVRSSQWRQKVSKANLRYWASPTGWREASRRHSALIFSIMVAFIPLLPRIAVVGPISLDDVLPGVAALYGLAAWRWGHLRLRVPLIGWLMAGVVVASVLPVVFLGLWPTLFSGPVRWIEAFVLIVLTFSFLRTRRDGIVYLIALASSVTFQAVFGLAAEALNWSGGNGYIGIERFRGYESIAGLFPGRITGTLAMPATFVAGFLAGGLPVCVGLALTRSLKHRWLAWVATGLVGLAVFFTFSRISLVAGAGFAFIVLIVRAPWKIWVPLLAVTVVGVFASPMRDRLLNDTNDRMQLWSAALAIVRDHPVLGVGAGRYLHFLPFYETTSWGVAGTTAHNSILLAWAEQGLFTAAFFTAAIVMALAPVIKALRWHDSALLGAVAGFAAFTMTGMFANLFFIPSVALAMWCLAAGAAALAAAGPPASAPEDEALKDEESEDKAVKDEVPEDELPQDELPVDELPVDGAEGLASPSPAPEPAES